MAVAGVLATALNTGTARSKGLYLGGNDVLLAPGTGGNRTGTPIDSIHVTEAGPNGVSSMEFTVEDPTLAAAVADGMDVRLQDHTLDYPVFLGWVQSWSAAPYSGNQGRTITVVAQGVETVLDWAVTTSDLNFPLGQTSIAAMIQDIVANSSGLGPIVALVGASSGIIDVVISTTYTFTIATGTTVREAIRLCWTAAVSSFLVLAQLEAGPPYLVTVDFRYALRASWANSGAPGLGSDYTDTTVVAGTAGTAQAESLTYASDASGIVRGVVVRGAGFAVAIGDSMGLPGQIGVIVDSTLTTIAMANDAARAYLATFASGIRGSYEQSDRAGSATIRAASHVTITDATVGLSARMFRIMQIDKTFNPSGRENWVVSFGGLPPSAAGLIRRLTRSTLS